MSTLIALVVVVVVGAATAASVLAAATSTSTGKPTRTGRSTEYRWHLVFRCHNEAATIGETLDHLATAFPEADVWVADECSTDETPDIVERVGAENPHIHLVRINRGQIARGSGYVLHTVYWAISRAIGRGADRRQTIVGLLQPVTRVSRETLDVLADRHQFGYADVGAVQIGQHRGGRRVRNPFTGKSAWRNFLGRMIFRVRDIELRGPIPAAQSRRHRTGTTELAGSGQFIRLAALDAVADRYGTSWPNVAEDGFEQSVRLALTGWRTAYAGQVWVTELGGWSLSAYVADRLQAMARALRTSARLPELWRCDSLPRRSRFDLVCSVLRPWGALGGSLLFLLPPTLFVLAVIGSPGGTAEFIAAGGWVAAVAYLLIASVELGCWGVVYGRRIDPRAGALRGLGWGFAHLALVPFHYAALWGGLYARLTGQSSTARPDSARQREVTVDQTAPTSPRGGVGEAVTDVFPAVPPRPAPVIAAGHRVVRPRRDDGAANENWTGALAERPRPVTQSRTGGRRVSHRH